MAKFEAGNDPADHNVAEVVEFLNGDDVTGDEYDRVMAAERAGKARVGIISLSGTEPAEAPLEELAAHPEAEGAPVVDVTEDEAEPEEERPATQTPEQARARAIEINEAARRERMGYVDPDADDESDADDSGE